jgi:hypothetical protein
MKSTLFTLLLILSCFAVNAQCNCPINANEPPVCVQDSTGTYFQLPNACFAACFGFTVLPDSLCNNPGGGWGCNCDIDPTEPFVCAQDSIGNYVEVPNACFALCFGLTIVSDSLCHSGGGGWPGDCGCTFDPNEPFVCAQDSSGLYYQVPNVCFANCYGLAIVADSLCNGGGWPGDCDCAIDSLAPFICVQDSLGNVFQVPNQCFADCYGFTVVADSLCNFIEPWADCGCDIDLEAPFLCAVDSLGHPCYVPNQCFATCLGLTIVSDSICALDSVIIYQDSFSLCLQSISATSFQEYILAAHNQCGMDVPQCILDAPLFNNDSLFFEYIISSCANITGGGNIMNIYNTFSARALSSKDENLDLYAVKIHQNPVQNSLEFTISAGHQSDVAISIMDINGQVKKQVRESLTQGENRMKVDVSTMNTGLYLLSIRDKDEVKTLKFVKQ